VPPPEEPAVADPLSPPPTPPAPEALVGFLLLDPHAMDCKQAANIKTTFRQADRLVTISWPRLHGALFGFMDPQMTLA
jgi:hypothetical protein